MFQGYENNKGSISKNSTLLSLILPHYRKTNKNNRSINVGISV